MEGREEKLGRTISDISRPFTEDKMEFELINEKVLRCIYLFLP